MPFKTESAQGYGKGRSQLNPLYPINPHRYYKKLKGTDVDTPEPWRPPPPPPPPPPTNECGYGEEDDADGGHCYVKEHILDKVIVRVRICVMPDGSMKTTHEVKLKGNNDYTQGVRIINDTTGDTDCRTIIKDFMLKTTAPITGGTYKTNSKLHPRVNYLTQAQVNDRFMDRSELTGAIAGAGTFAVALFWFWKAVMFFYEKKMGDKKRIVFRTTDRTTQINASRNAVSVEREGLYYNFAFTLQRGEKGEKTICQR